MNLLFVYYTHKRGGLCARLYRAMNACATSGCTVTYCTLDTPPDLLVPGVQVRLIPFPIKSRNGLLFWAALLVWLPVYLLFVCLRIRPDRLVAFGAFYSAMLYLASVVSRAPVILYLRSLVFKNDRIAGRNRLVRYISGCVECFGLRRARKVVSMTRAMQLEAEDFAGRKFKLAGTLSNDIPLVRANPAALPTHADSAISRGAMLVATSGVLDKRKNAGVLIEALDLIPRGLVHLLVVGSGSEVESLSTRVVSLGKELATFIGWSDQPESFICCAQLYLHPSVHEGVSNSMLEAISLGIPVLVSDIPEHRELFAESLQCLVPPLEASAWCKAISRYVADEAFRHALQEGTKRVREQLTFDWDSKFLETLRLV